MPSLRKVLDLEKGVKMYSPKIQPEKIKRLYLTSKDKGIPMTSLLDEILADYFRTEDKRKKEHAEFYINK